VRILRTYNNNTNAVDAIMRALDNGIGILYIVVNGEKEEGRGTIASKVALDARLKGRGHRVRVIEMNRGYSWSPALNVALREIHATQAIAQMQGKRGSTHILCFSTEVMWSPDHLQEMLDAMNNPYVAVSGAPFEAYDRERKVELGVTYRHPRNTFALWKTGYLLQAGDFDPWCDTLGGQEDFEMILRMSLFLQRDYAMIDTPVRLAVGANYDQVGKEQRELDSTRSIIKLWYRRMAANPQAMDILSDILKDRFHFVPLS
jgi:GT2 family glycosyltransferase